MRAALLFWAKLVFCYMELLKYCRNVADVKTMWYDEVVPKNHHPHLRLKHRRADAEHIRPETNPIFDQRNAYWNAIGTNIKTSWYNESSQAQLWTVNPA